MSKAIKDIYRKAKVKPPDGKGLHTKKFHEMAVAIKKNKPSMTMKSAYAIAMSKLGPEKAVKAAHRRYGKTNEKAKQYIKSKGCK